jgi:succinyl-CoA synthetase alpha subunit
VISRSGTLTYEACLAADLARPRPVDLHRHRRRPINGMSHLDAAEAFQRRSETYAMIVIGEIGGSAKKKPPSGSRKLRQAVAGVHRRARLLLRAQHGTLQGAIVSGGKGTAEGKIEALRAAALP